MRLQMDANGKIPVGFVRGEERLEVWIDGHAAGTDRNVALQILTLASGLPLHEAIRLTKQLLDIPDNWKAVQRLAEALAKEPIVVIEKRNRCHPADKTKSNILRRKSRERRRRPH